MCVARLICNKLINIWCLWQGFDSCRWPMHNNTKEKHIRFVYTCLNMQKQKKSEYRQRNPPRHFQT